MLNAKSRCQYGIRFEHEMKTLITNLKNHSTCFKMFLENKLCNITTQKIKRQVKEM